MTNLFEEVKSSFEATREDRGGGEGISIVASDDVIAPGFMGMRSYYSEQVEVMARRGYRHWAGATMPTNTDELLAKTSDPMLGLTLSVIFRAFADGVRIGQQNEHYVKMLTHFNAVDDLFTQKPFRDTSNTMAAGFTADNEIFEYLTQFVKSGTMFLSHATGSAHQEIEPVKVWDLWILAGQACFSATYLAGIQLGTTWRERDVLDGIEIATDKEVTRGPAGEAPDAD